jgi:hypothetical protein
MDVPPIVIFFTHLFEFANAPNRSAQAVDDSSFARGTWRPVNLGQQTGSRHTAKIFN